MKNKNIWKDVKYPLEIHSDNRGSITDIFYNTKIDHVAVITSEPNSIRGNHYHKETTQHILITHGSLEYWYKPIETSIKPKKIVANKGDLISTPPNEIHALKIGKEGNEFIVFSEGLRGGKDYESDTYRVPNIIENEL
jgi:dTDP-4-dehydrorhamnose 3,5-epimerase-like enzyme